MRKVCFNTPVNGDQGRRSLRKHSSFHNQQDFLDYLGTYLALGRPYPRAEQDFPRKDYSCINILN